MSSPVGDTLLDLVLADEVPAAAAVGGVEESALGLGIPATESARLAAVVRELVAEARERETFGDQADPVHVTANHVGADLVVHVTDHRMPAVGETYARLMSFRLSALGFVRDLEFTLAGDGNVARCAIAVPSRASWLDTEQIQPHDIARVDDATAALVEFRAALPDDAAAITRLTFRCYGYTYLDEAFYAPDVLARSLKQGELQAYVAVTPDGDVVGLQALTADASGGLVPEFGKLMVDARYRRRQFAERLAQQLLTDARGQGIPGAWAECVANHAASQRTVQAAGGTEVGLLLGASPQAVAMAGFEVHDEGRRSLVSMYIPLATQGTRTSYLPARLIPVYIDCVKRMGLEREAHDIDVQPAGHSQFQVSSRAAIGRARISLERLAPDALQRIAAEVAGLDTERLAVMYLDIPLADPAAARAIRIAEQRGFFWAALLPDARPDGDVLRLQRLADVPIDTGHIQTISDHGAAMVAFILSERDRAAEVLAHSAAATGPTDS